MNDNLIDRLKQRDERAFKELVDQYQQMVFSTCLGIVHDYDDADDVVQDVFIEAFRSVDNFRADSKISTWLYRIAVNKSLNFIRDNKRRRFFQSIGAVDSPEIADEQHMTDMPYHSMVEKERTEILHQAIDSLPGKQRTAFVLSKYEELPYAEIAEVMKTSVSSVESLLFRAKKNLQKKLLHCYKKSC
ncbi:MAG: sigma-70 family RNA polymerase sigma factor [Prolixibacteraceae bacterium]|jgi:RNA polymerase sigma-70 factor (ECF subfamily)|nr:sigma-70 family RNA polymerase sigma factor [Prolixibacteraceae bacterium]